MTPIRSSQLATLVGIAAAAGFLALPLITNAATDPDVTLSAPSSITVFATTTLLSETSGAATDNAELDAITPSMTPANVSLSEASGGAPYTNVRIDPIGDSSGHLQIWAKDSTGQWYDVNITGWGPAAGFPITADGSTVTTPVYVFSDQANTYSTTINLVDLSAGNNVVATASGTITVTYPTTVYVNATDNTCGGNTPCYSTIQAGINAVAAGGTVMVDAGTYTEQLTIGKSLTLTGAGAANTIIEAPATLSTDVSGNLDIVDIASTTAAVNVNMSGFTVNGPGSGSCGSINNGIYVGSGATADISNNTITNIEDSSLSGCQNGTAIRAGNNSGDTATLTADSNTANRYQKSGIVVEGVGSTGTITNNTITGVGSTTAIAQNGIEVNYGATGVVSGNTVSDNDCTLANPSDDCTADPASSNPNSDGAAGILLYSPGSSVTVENNTLTDNQYSIWTVGAPSITISGNTVTGSGDGPGIAVQDTDQWGAPVESTSGTISGNTLSGSDYGVLVRNYSGGTGPAVTVSGNNDLSGNTVALYSDVATNATSNFWGSTAGPTVGTDIQGATTTITYSPWLCAVGGSTTTNGTSCTPAPTPTPSGGGGNGPIAGGGGGGGGSTPVALPNNGSTATTTATTTAPAGQVLGASAYNFAVNFGMGISDEDVTQLQMILIQDGYLDITAPTGYFGPLTQAAVVKFQAANGISPTSGYVGPLTRTVLNRGTIPTAADEQNSLLLQQLEKQLQQLEAQIASLTSSSTATSTATTTIQ